jgi:hypothetical protein
MSPGTGAARSSGLGLLGKYLLLIDIVLNSKHGYTNLANIKGGHLLPTFSLRTSQSYKSYK